MTASHHDGAALLRELDRRMSRVGELPGLSDTIRRIVDAMRAEGGLRERDMTDTVLQDVTLTQRVMRLANSPMYAMFGDSVDSISRALYVLGTDAVGHLALGLAVLEQLDANCPGTALARDEMHRSRAAGEIARQLAGLAHPQSAERAAVCSILHGLGRLLVSYYLPERWAIVRAQVRTGTMDETEAARRCLGITPTEIGRHVAQGWGLPASITAVLRDLEPGRAGTAALTHDDWLAAIASYAGRCAQIVHDSPHEDPATLASLRALGESFSGLLRLEPEVLCAAAQRVQAQVRLDAPRPVQAREPAQPPARNRIESDACAPMRHALGDIALLAGHANLGQLFQRGLDAMQETMRFRRSVLFLRNAREQRYVARMFAGADTGALRTLAFPDPREDRLGEILAGKRAVSIASASIGRGLPSLPAWLERLTLGTPGFFALPVHAGSRPVALFYGDWGRKPEIPLVGVEVLRMATRLAQALGKAAQRSNAGNRTPRETTLSTRAAMMTPG